MASQIVGRDEELEFIRRFIASSPDDVRALVLEGAAGIGKSTLWRAGVDEAAATGSRVLSTRPAEMERLLAFAGLGDLFEGALEEILPVLSPPRRRALEIALLLEAEEDPLDPRALAVAVRSALESLAERHPLVLAVDDVQWLDPSSADALAFAVRRMSTPMRVLLARRVAHGLEPSALERALPDTSYERVEVGSLSSGALHVIVRDRLGRAVSRPTLLRIHEVSGGNPFYALEIARTLGPEVDPTQPLPLSPRGPWLVI
jgi:predicted ATPase